MYDNYDQTAWRTEEQLIEDSLKRVFGTPPKDDERFERLLNKLSDASGRRDCEKS